MSKLLKILLILAIIAFSTSFFYIEKLPKKETILDLSLKSPLQTPTDESKFKIQKEEYTAEIEPLYDYEIWGLVVEDYDSENFFDFMHKNDPFNIKDICVLWGDNVKEELYDNFEFKHGEFTCYFRTRDMVSYKKFNPEQLSNNHLIPASEEIYKAIKSTRIGDQVYLKGKLAKYTISNSERVLSSRGTSVTREDRGNGACETIYVDKYEVVKEGNRAIRDIYEFSFYTIISTIILLLILLFYDSHKALKPRTEEE